MAVIDILAVAVVFVAGMIAGVIILVSAASRREDRGRRLRPEAPDRLTAAGRYLTSLYIRRSNSGQASHDESAAPEADLPDQQRRWPD